MKNVSGFFYGSWLQKHCRLGAILGCSLIFSAWISDALAAKEVNCPAEVKGGTEFPMTDSNHVTWHNSNSLNFNLDYKAVCSWKNVTPSQRKEGHVCTYSTFSDCSVEGTPANTKLYLTDYKPKISSAVKPKK